MKIAIRGGHSLDIRGASGFLDEVNEDRKIKDLVIKHLRQMGHEVLDVTPSKSGSSSADLNYGVSKANAWGADYFASIHLNAGGGIGTEVLYYGSSNQGKKYAERISFNISSLGFKNRGAKADVRGLYELRHTKMAANIVEVCFVDTKTDADLYNSIGVDRIAKAIVEGILGHSIQSKTTVQPNTKLMHLKVIHDMVAMGLNKNGQIFPVKEFRKGDLITVQRIVNRLGEIDVYGQIAYITIGYTTKR